MRKLSASNEGLYIEKKSKFICHLYKVKDETEIQEILKAEKKKYFDAKHHCYAYVLGETGALVKCNDDGEPSQTAGKPMLDILQKEGFTDILCVVIRYFGGTLLGTGGLVRAYSEALKDAIDKSEFVNEIPAVIVEYKYAYNFDAKIASYLRDNGIKILSTEYSDSINLKIALPEGDLEKTGADLVNITNGSIEELSKEKCMYSF